MDHNNAERYFGDEHCVIKQVSFIKKIQLF